jgi:hypothetical protein
MVLDTGNTNRSLPLGSLPPGTSLFVAVGVGNALPAGTYTFSIGLAVDGAAPVFVPSGEKSTLFAPVAHKWSGTACMSKPDMMSQIPPSADHHYYVCPQV